jgi:hypothetical protein
LARPFSLLSLQKQKVTNQVRNKHRIENISRPTPRPTVHWALLFGRRGSYPLEETVHMKYVTTFSPYFHQSEIGQIFITIKEEETQLSGQSSPGILQLGQQPSYGTLQMPHTSPSSSIVCWSVPVSQRHVATACQCFTVTFMVVVRNQKLCEFETRAYELVWFY